jgi:hypothetical protein
MQKDPIVIDPTEQDEYMVSTSRPRLGKTYRIECNAKMRNIGMVGPEDKQKLLRYYKEELDNGCESND